MSCKTPFMAVRLAQAGGMVMAQGDFADAGWRAKHGIHAGFTCRLPLSVRELWHWACCRLLGAAEAKSALIPPRSVGARVFCDPRIDTLSGGEKARVYLPSGTCCR